ncbi:glycosyltransferase family 4 protein [Marinobacter lipolyticus]|uniref:glycosyltransferase family 4 protein n=1 Tax=Marinobacter lipolyticus TaxID=209639 RepID=UPI003A9271A7
MAPTGDKSPLRVLLVGYYFPPDLCAGSFRAKALADALVASGCDIDLDVVTTEPNRYQSHRPSIREDEDYPYSVYRVPLPDAHGGLLGQVRSFGQFARKARHLIPGNQYDVVVATSSRLMTACLGAWLAPRLGAKLYLDIRDIFVETITDVFPGRLLWPVRRLFDGMERWALGRADRVNLVSEGFLPYFRQRYQRGDYAFFTNGIDSEFVFSTEPSSGGGVSVESDDLPEVVYAGNIGDGQGLDKIIPELAIKTRDYARFTVVGDGGTRGKLVERCRELNAPVTLVDAVPRSQLLDIYQSADVLFLHLNDLPAFKRVLPSKLFEYAALGKPILAGVSGYAKDFIQERIEGAEVFDPCDVGAAEQALRRLTLKHYRRDEFVNEFRREAIMKRMADDIIHVATGQRDG